MTARKRCPICRKPATAPYRPFCSQRCADIDLGRWLDESYRLPAEPVRAEEVEEESKTGGERGGAHGRWH